jgi:hypothetical protein
MSPARDVAFIDGFVQQVSDVQLVQNVCLLFVVVAGYPLFSAISPAMDVAFLDGFVQQVSDVQLVQNVCLLLGQLIRSSQQCLLKGTLRLKVFFRRLDFVYCLLLGQLI